MSTDPPRQPTQEELQAAYEAELKRIRVEDVLVQTLVSLINLGGRRAGLAQGAEEERDPEQLRLAIEGSRALLPLVQDLLGPDAQQVQTALSQLQMAYSQIAQGGGEGAPAPSAGDESRTGEPQRPDSGSAQSSGKLWVPGQ
jgi:hypothetical protein